MSDKVGQHDLIKIWKHFDRFALYEDLKELHQKTLPEIIKFEQRIIDFKNELNTQTQIIGRMDTVMSTKSSKIAIKQIYDHLEDNYMLKKTNDQFLLQANKHMDKVAKDSEEYTKLFKNMSNQIQIIVNREVQLATLHLNSSEFEQQANGVVIKERDVKIL